jgi:hypothetical protein
LVTVAAIQNAVAAWMLQNGKGNPIWRWYPERENLDFAAACHGFLLTETEILELRGVLNAEFSEKATFEWQSGFLNLHFRPNFWTKMLDEGLQDPQSLLNFLQIDPAVNTQLRLWPYRWLVSIHEASILANLPGWESSDLMNYAPQPHEIRWMKQMLALPSLLQQKGDLDRKRTDIMKGLTTILQQMWKDPILTPLNMNASAFRQRLLRLILIVATAIGEPLSQAPKDAIGILE